MPSQENFFPENTTTAEETDLNNMGQTFEPLFFSVSGKKKNIPPIVLPGKKQQKNPKQDNCPQNQEVDAWK
jgi:hypothetical protein